MCGTWDRQLMGNDEGFLKVQSGFHHHHQLDREMRKKFALNVYVCILYYIIYISYYIITYWDNNLPTLCSLNLLNLNESPRSLYYSHLRNLLVGHISADSGHLLVNFEHNLMQNWPNGDMIKSPRTEVTLRGGLDMTVPYISIYISSVEGLKFFGFIFLEGTIWMKGSSWSWSTKWIWPLTFVKLLQ